MDSLPVFLTIKDQPCLLVGGAAAAAKTRLLLKAGARLTVVAADPCDALTAAAERGELRLVVRAFEPSDLADQCLVISAAGQSDIDTAVSTAARRNRIPVNVVDRKDLSSFIVPAVIDRDPVVVAISTDGAAPVLARRLRERIEAMLPARIGRLARFADSFRDAVRAASPDSGDAPARRRLWERVFDGPIAEAVLRGDEASARTEMLTLVNRAAPSDNTGRVHIVGAGPGDPELMTLRALRRLQEADVIIHDKLIGPDILDYARRDAERIYVGKSKGNHSRSQAEINALMAHHAAAGKTVVRLKGGDPFVFGRGGEELDYLLARGIPVEVVPGITAATGCAAAAGIPLTHRDHAGAVTFVSGHAKDGEPALDWAGLAKSGQTLVIYMGLTTAGRIAGRLIEHGMAPGTPAAIIENGTLPEQKLAIATLGTLESAIAQHRIDGPALVVIGAVAALAAGAETEPWRLAAAE